MLKNQKTNPEKATAFSGTLVLVLSLILFLPGNSFAAVTGQCSNCHTMHNMQNGASITGGDPDATLLINDCLGCHTGTNDGTNSIPYVYSTTEPTHGTNTLAGGNFYWVKTDDDKGHNVFSDNPDDTISVAPGIPTGGAQNACGNPTTSCHYRLDNVDPMLGTRQGCTKCHMMRDNYLKYHHHADDSNTVVGSDIGDTDAFFRFLQGHMSGAGRGVSGIEDADWGYTVSAADHNEYLGNSSVSKTAQQITPFATSGHTMTAFCSGCHGAFHHEKDGSSNWIRHPSDAVIPNSGEYASMSTTYNPAVPVARATLGSVSDTITLGTDMVMCLSCHVAHGSPYSDMLRWNYDDMVAGGGGSGGCFTCHTEKN